MPLTPAEHSRRDRRRIRSLYRELSGLSGAVDLLWTCFVIPLAERVRVLEERLPKIEAPEGQTMDEVIYKAIQAAIVQTGSRRGAALQLKVDEATIRNRIKKWEEMGRVRAGSGPYFHKGPGAE